MADFFVSYYYYDYYYYYHYYYYRSYFVMGRFLFMISVSVVIASLESIQGLYCSTSICSCVSIFTFEMFQLLRVARFGAPCQHFVFLHAAPPLRIIEGSIRIYLHNA